MARLKIAYIGGGSTRAPGTVEALVERGKRFAGSQVVLVDLDAEHLDVVRRLGTRMARHRAVDLEFVATTDCTEALTDCDVVLTSLRPGGFKARIADERIPLRHGVIGQETQGPGGFFMALRAIHVLQRIAEDIERRCPHAWVLNYTNPVNIVSEALTRHTPLKVVSLCEGPIVFPRRLAVAAGLDPDRIEATMIGLNHACWSVRHAYDGVDLIELVAETYERKSRDAREPRDEIRLLWLAATMGAVPATYFSYYYFHDEVLEELRSRPTTRAEDIVARIPGYWAHYREQADAAEPALDRRRSRDGIGELELALDVLDALANDADETYPVNIPNRGFLPGFPDGMVVEVPAQVSAAGVEPIPQPGLPRHVAGLVQMLGEYQAATAEAAWSGGRLDAIRALAAHPLVLTLPKAEALYEEMSAAHADHLPERLLR